MGGGANVINEAARCWSESFTELKKTPDYSAGVQSAFETHPERRSNYKNWQTDSCITGPSPPRIAATRNHNEPNTFAPPQLQMRKKKSQTDTPTLRPVLHGVSKNPAGKLGQSLTDLINFFTITNSMKYVRNVTSQRGSPLRPECF